MAGDGEFLFELVDAVLVLVVWEADRHHRLGVRAGEAARRNPALGEARIKNLMDWVEAGKIRPHISHRLPVENYAEAMRLLIDRKATGRVALMMR